MSEITTLFIGTAIAKAVLSSWFKDNEFLSSGTDSFIDIFSAKLGDRRAASAAKRQLERISEKAADTLAPIIEHEWRNIPDHEASAAADEAGRAIEKSNINQSTLARIDYDPMRLFEMLLAHTDRTMLSADSRSLLERLLREAAQLIVDTSNALPSAGNEPFAEILKRESDIIASIDKVFDEFEVIKSIAKSFSPEASDTYFEELYRKAVGRELDGIELFGIDSQTKASSRHHNLTTAYISLSASHFDVTNDSDEQDRGLSAGEPLSQNVRRNYLSLKVESVAADFPRIVIRGEAGSGKTTLLQSLAVRSATSSFSSDMAEWNQIIPFFVRLRAIGDKLPRLEDFPGLVAPSIAGMMPTAWVHRQFAAGRAALLVDGLDEVSNEKREMARKWIKEILTSFPNCRVIVTSRPAVISDNWLKSDEFKHIELLPMAFEDISNFVDHWHSAVHKGETNKIRRDELANLPDRLKERIRTDRALRELAATPLLCAMLCAMNRDRREVLPSTRVALYEAAVSMMVHGRDEQRKIDVIDLPSVDFFTKVAVLQEIAFWMMQNNWSMADRWRLTDYVKTIINRYTRLLTIDADRFVELLVQRSGVLRSPIEGKIDFIHNAFKEYLCAKSVAIGDHFGYLLETLNQESWREVATLAPALTDENRRADFLEKLLAKGDRSRNGSMYYLLAVRCMEACTSLSPQIQIDIRDRISRLGPPKTFGEAKSLSGAGELAIPLISKGKNGAARPTAACVRALRYIGTPAALEALEAFASDQRLTVLPEISSAWPFFDKAEYVRRIIAKNRDLSKKLYIGSLSMLEGISALVNLEVLSIYAGGASLADWHYEEIAPLQNLRGLNVARATAFDIRRILNATNLSSIALDVHSVQNFDAVTQFDKLYGLGLDVSESVIFPDLSSLDNLRVIQLRSPAANGFHADRLPSQISEIHSLVGGVSGLPFYSGKMNKIDRIDVQTDVNSKTLADNLEGCSVRFLGLTRSPSLHDLDGLDRLPRLASLVLRGAENLARIDNPELMNQLTDLHIVGKNKIDDISALASAANIERLSIDVADHVNLDSLQQLPRLRQVHIPYNMQDRVTELGLKARVSIRPSFASSISVSGGRIYLPLSYWIRP